MTFPAGWIVPDWPAPPGVKAACSTRSGGESPAPFDTLNLGDHVGDDPRHVANNRRVFAAALGARPVFLQQVHGRDCAVLARDSADGTRADGAVTSDPGCGLHDHGRRLPARALCGARRALPSGQRTRGGEDCAAKAGRA